MSVCQCVRKRPNSVENTLHLGGERKCIFNQSKPVFQESISQLSQALSDLQALFSEKRGRVGAGRASEPERPWGRMGRKER